MQNLRLLHPEIVLTCLALVLLAADFLSHWRKGKLLYHFAILSAAVTLGVVGLAYGQPALYQGTGTLWAVDPLSLFFKVLILGTTILVLFLCADYREGRGHSHPGSFGALILLAAVGMMLLVSAADLLLILLSLELVSIASFILVGYERGELKSTEGGIKYFLIGALSSAVLVYGISLFYGAAGTTNLMDMPPLFARETPKLLLMACLLMTVGFGFKISMVPFHLWVPDAYEGAPTPVTAFLSVAPKVAALAVLLRVFTHLVPHSMLDLTLLFTFLAMLTMTVGNLTALFQTNVKRLLAYSSIAQAGYMLIGFVTGGPLGREGILLYSLVYAFMNLGAFAVVIAVGNEDGRAPTASGSGTSSGYPSVGYELEAYDGLARRNLGLALMMAFFLLSLAGIPPLAGFIAKFYLFAAAVKGGFYWLAVVAVLNSVVSVYYYMRIAYHMFFREPRYAANAFPTARPLSPGIFLYSVLSVATAAVLVMGVYPEPFVAAVKVSAEFFLPGLGLGAGAIASLP